MGMTQQTKGPSEETIAAYKNRLKGNEELVKEVQKTMDGFRKDQMEMAATLNANAIALRENIAKKQKERLISFDAMIAGVRKDVKDIQTSTSDFLKAFTVSHDEMAGELNEMFSQDQAGRFKWNADRKILNADRLENFENQMKGIQSNVTQLFKDTNDLLKKSEKDRSDMSSEMRNTLNADVTERVASTKEMLLKFHQRLSEINRENQEMASSLRKNLSKNDEQRLKDFNVMFIGIQNRVQEIEKYVIKFLNEFSSNRKQAAAAPANIAKPISKIKDSFEAAPVPVKQVAKKKELQVEVVVAKEIVIEKAATIAEAVPAVAESPKRLSLEEKVLDHLSKNKDGVRVSDMEGPLGETRMRIGFITKKLLDEGKVRKIESSYYPIA
jgi:hypothetical protein